MAKTDAGFVAFFLMWAKVMGWTVPMLHVRICHWLETCDDPIRVLMIFRGAAKSTIYAVYKAWKLYRDRNRRSLIWAADGDLAKKLTRDTLNVLRRHPLCAGMLPPKPGAQTFWVNGAADARNASMNAVGVNQNATGSRADDIDYDDVEVPKNIKTAEARANLRMKIEESTFIAVPGAQETYIGTPHTHDSIYPELVSGGAALLKIPLFEDSIRYEQTDRALRYRIPFEIGEDGLYVMTGIHKFSRLLEEGIDYRVEGGEVVFTAPPNAVLDLYAHCAWPERFTREDVIKRRKKTRTLNYWDSQYMLEAKPITETRLDPAKIIPYAVEPVIKYANKTATMWLGAVRIAGMSVRWDPSSAKLGSDVSAIALVLQDDHGRRYLHRVKALTGEIAEFAEDGKRILGGQVFQICDLVEKFNVPRVTVETNGIGGFAPAVLKAALKQRKLVCGVAEEHAVVNKNKRILEAYEGPLSAGMLWAHTEVLDGEFWDQMKDFNPGTQAQEDDLIDAGAGAITDTPERIKVNVRDEDGTPRHHAWRPNAGVHEVAFER
jgi:hypothetical protein